MKIMFNGVRLNTSPTETRQVPPLQQYLFNIVLEAVALTITPKKEMKAIKNWKEGLIWLFADNMTIYVKNPS